MGLIESSSQSEITAPTVHPKKSKIYKSTLLGCKYMHMHECSSAYASIACSINDTQLHLSVPVCSLLRYLLDGNGNFSVGATEGDVECLNLWHDK